jgi:hypothetical protein
MTLVPSTMVIFSAATLIIRIARRGEGTHYTSRDNQPYHRCPQILGHRHLLVLDVDDVAAADTSITEWVIL